MTLIPVSSSVALAALVLEGWRCAVDGHSRDRRVDGRPSIDGVSENVQHPSEDRVSDRNGDGGSDPPHPGSATKPAGPLQGDSANGERIVVTLDLRHDVAAGRHLDFQRLPDRWKCSVQERNVQDRAPDRLYESF